MKQLRARWAQRTRREQTLLALLAALLVTLMLWLWGWQPLARALTDEARRQAQLMTLSRQLARLPERVGDTGMENLLRQRAAAQGITLSTVVRRENQLQITVASASADALLEWLLTLDAQGIVQVQALNMQGKASADGSVSASLLLEPR